MKAEAKALKKRSFGTGTLAHSFWRMAHILSSQSEQERLRRIHSGFEAVWLIEVKRTFDLTNPALALLTNSSSSTVERRIKSKALLDSVISERIDRLAQIAVLAEEIFEDKAGAGAWMSSPNDALGGKTPLSLCETELGGRQVHRVLHAIEWGGVA